jgi:hypothetical protein
MCQDSTTFGNFLIWCEGRWSGEGERGGHARQTTGGQGGVGATVRASGDDSAMVIMQLRLSQCRRRRGSVASTSGDYHVRNRGATIFGNFLI